MYYLTTEGEFDHLLGELAQHYNFDVVDVRDRCSAEMLGAVKSTRYQHVPMLATVPSAALAHLDRGLKQFPRAGYIVVAAKGAMRAVRAALTHRTTASLREYLRGDGEVQYVHRDEANGYYVATLGHYALRRDGVWEVQPIPAAERYLGDDFRYATEAEARHAVLVAAPYRSL